MAFIATGDGVRSRVFYESTLGLAVKSDDAFALAIDANGTTLRIQKIGPFAPHSFTALGWEVSDINSVVTSLRVRGVIFERFPGMDQDERGIWSAPSGARVAWFRDPDGNTLSITQL
jgi:catechol 2,3-dioxygenase-like lactoylglutathione lyase family enzyme